MTSELHVLRVFVDAASGQGNALGVFLDGADVPPARRQEIAADLGYSETVFVEDGARGQLRIYTPSIELPFAGHPLVGTAWLLHQSQPECTVLRPPAGEVPFRLEDGLTWIVGRASQAPAWDLIELETVADVDALSGAPGDSGHAYAWAWEDQSAGRVRARAFAPDYGVAEDPATGSAGVRLGDALGRPLHIRQGSGSEILVSPTSEDVVEVGGRVVLDERRPYDV